MNRYSAKVRDARTIEVHGPGCESFLVTVPGSADVDAAIALACRITTLLEHAHHAGRQAALCTVRRALEGKL